MEQTALIVYRKINIYQPDLLQRDNMFIALSDGYAQCMSCGCKPSSRLQTAANRRNFHNDDVCTCVLGKEKKRKDVTSYILTLTC